MIKNDKGLKVWQNAYQLCIKIYKITKGFPIGGEIWINFTDKKSCCISSIKSDDLKNLQRDIGDIERMLKALIKSLENKHLNP